MLTGTRQQSDANAEHDIYDDDAISDYPQSGELINLHALRSHHVRRIRRRVWLVDRRPRFNAT